MIKWNQELTLVVVQRVWQHAPATAAYPQSWRTVPILHYGVRRSVLDNLDLEVRVCFQQGLLHCPKEPSADSLIPPNQSTTFIQTFISCHLDRFVGFELLVMCLSYNFCKLLLLS